MDIDLRLMGPPGNALATLQEAARRDLGDFMAFEVGPSEGFPENQNDGTLYDGLRFRAECQPRYSDGIGSCMVAPG
jgi:hypothetical protein